MEKRPFGTTGLHVAPLGLGTAELGFLETDQSCCDRLLGFCLDLGMNVVDTAACYADSELKVGKAISSRRDAYVLVSKCGHQVDGLDAPAWSPQIVTASVERSLQRLRTDRLDVLLLHSCTPQQLNDDQMIHALAKAKQEGKTRLIGYSGDAEAAAKAVVMSVFDAIETSVNFVDQQPIDTYLPMAQERGLGVLVKRPIANGCWRETSELGEFYAGYAEPYAKRLATMGLTPESIGFDGGWAELALRFSVHQPGVSCAVTGSRSIDHLRENATMLEKGPLADSVVCRLRDLWRQHDDGTWVGQV